MKRMRKEELMQASGKKGDMGKKNLAFICFPFKLLSEMICTEVHDMVNIHRKFLWKYWVGFAHFFHLYSRQKI